jgi:hypothetical protein
MYVDRLTLTGCVLIMGFIFYKMAKTIENLQDRVSDLEDKINPDYDSFDEPDDD